MPQPAALLLTGTCGSGKTTLSTLIAQRPEWHRVSEDDCWLQLFGRDRGAFGSEAHRRKRTVVHARVLATVANAAAAARNIVIDATVHEAPPEAFEEYRAALDAMRIPWCLCVLHPRLEVAISRDARRPQWSVGAARVAALHAKFSGAVFPPAWFLDTSEDSVERAAERVLERMCLLTSA